MKKRIPRTLSLVLCALLLGGCSSTSQDTSDTSTSGATNTGETTNTAADTSNTGSDETTVTDSSGQSKEGMVTAGEYKPTVEEIKDTASKLEHLTVSENLCIDFPQDLEHFYAYNICYPGLPYPEGRDKFNKICEFVFPGKTINEDYLMYTGSYIQMDENGQYPPRRRVRDYEDELIAGTEDYDGLYCIHDNDPKVTPMEDTISIVMLNPPFGSLVYLNRGEINHKMGDVATQYLYPEDHPDYFEFVGTYDPEDTTSFKLFDGETRICDATENLSAELNELWKHVFGEVPTDQVLRASSVQVYRLLCGEDVYVYWFTLYNEYKGLAPCYKSEDGYSFPKHEETFPLEINAGRNNPHAFMARSDQFDFAAITGFHFTVRDEREITEFYSASAALEAVRGRLTQGVDFELESIGLWELESYEDGVPEYAQGLDVPGWIIMLHNLQDDFYYECFISAIDLDVFAYQRLIKD